ncbi:kazrin isoform X2 [Harmonia axyridis]|uniref:kazrin isoform X2 n=1 Tax=Harmonia axyridis TaxID=115357 RepID=UPI001E275134|nr:kazrin isoform X2 [Harmonia axyridis]
MAMLMRRLFVDTQVKFRRMVEEHSANLTSRINSDYPNTIPAPLSSPSSQFDNLRLSNSSSEALDSFVTPLLSADKERDASSDLDVRTAISELKKEGYRSSRPSSIESRRSKSLVNASSASVDSGEEAKPSKRDVKKTRSNPVRCSETQNVFSDRVSEYKNNIMTVDENVSPLKDRSSPDSADRLSKTGSPKPGCSSHQDAESSSSRSPRSSDGNQDELSSMLSSPTSYPKSALTIRKLRLENERLQAELTRLRRLVVSGATSVLADKKTPTESSADPTGKIHSLEMELQLAKEALLTLKSDRRRLKAEKYDLLNQMKDMYGTLDDKEKELRDFIRNFNTRVRDTNSSVQQLSTEREERERERWSLLRHARDEAERSLSLAAQLNAKEVQLQIAQEQLQEARRQLASSGCLSDQESLASLPRHGINGGALTPGSGGLISGHHGLGLISGDRGSCSADSGVRVSSDRESGATSIAGNLSDSTTDGTPTITIEGGNIDADSVSIVSSLPPPHMYQTITTKDCSPTLSPLNANNFSRSIDSSVLSRSVEQLSSPIEPEPISISRRPKQPQTRTSGGRGGTWGSISRVFARSRHRNKASSLQETSEHAFEPYRSWSPLTEEGYAEKLRLLREASTIPMERWRAPTVLAWIEIALGMPQYGARCAENIKSGKVLLELSDLELECGLGVTHPMHRKKLRLAVEEHRHPSLVRYPCISQLGHTWVSSEWLPDLGLSQYGENFASNMVDARMLEHLSKKELEKYLGVNRKFHQASIVHGIHLLRIMKYDRQALAVRRHQCETMDADPLVWTNHRFIRWARSIDLGEYADNLKDSGVHGGLVVLEPSFNGDTMATALGIPSSKSIIRRHLTAELEALVLPARSTLEHYVRLRAKSRATGGSLGRTFSRSCAGLAAPHPTSVLSREQHLTETRRSTIRGSITRALGLSKTKSERDREKHSPTSSSESSSIRSRASPTYFYKASRSGGESPIYAQPFANQHPPSMYNRKSEDYDIYLNRRSMEDYETKNPPLPKPDRDRNSTHSGKLNPFEVFVGGKPSHKPRKQHRRVRSISDIDAINSEPAPT